jgi:hypothetical protein
MVALSAERQCAATEGSSWPYFDAAALFIMGLELDDHGHHRGGEAE